MSAGSVSKSSPSKLICHSTLAMPLGALALAALFSAEVSTADAVLFMLSTSLARDLYAAHLRPAATQAEQLRIVRLAAIASGAIGVAIAIWAGSIVRTMGLFYSVLSAGLFVPVVAGLYVRRTGTPEAFAAIGAGIAALVAAQLGTGGRGPLPPVLVGLLAGVAACALSLILRRRRPDTSTR